MGLETYSKNESLDKVTEATETVVEDKVETAAEANVETSVEPEIN